MLLWGSINRPMMLNGYVTKSTTVEQKSWRKRGRDSMIWIFLLIKLFEARTHPFLPEIRNQGKHSFYFKTKTIIYLVILLFYILFIFEQHFLLTRRFGVLILWSHYTLSRPSRSETESESIKDATMNSWNIEITKS